MLRKRKSNMSRGELLLSLSKKGKQQVSSSRKNVTAECVLQSLAPNSSSNVRSAVESPCPRHITAESVLEALTPKAASNIQCMTEPPTEPAIAATAPSYEYGKQQVSSNQSNVTAESLLEALTPKAASNTQRMTEPPTEPAIDALRLISDDIMWCDNDTIVENTVGCPNTYYDILPIHDNQKHETSAPIDDIEGTTESDTTEIIEFDETIMIPQNKKKRIRNEDEKLNRDNCAHPLTDCCNDTCRKQCIKKIPKNRRKEIWTAYWGLPYNERKMWLFHNIERTEKGTQNRGEHQSRRSLTYIYRLKDSHGVAQTVCKIFFLTTLGYDRKNDKPIVTALKCPSGTVTPYKDQRGRHEPANKIDRTAIREHIESHHPCVSHYRREHAPNRRYLPSDINIMDMHKDFKLAHDEKCCYDLYIL